MVQIVENIADITGTLLSVGPAPDRSSFVELRVAVDAAVPVDARPNLFERDVGTTIAVLAREGGPAAGITVGPVRLRVRKGGPTTVFAVDD
jgi:hypothetical protein